MILTNTFNRTATATAYYLYLLLIAGETYANQVRNDFDVRVQQPLDQLLLEQAEANRSVSLEKLVGKYCSPYTGYAEVFERDGTYRLRIGNTKCCVRKVGEAPSASILQATSTVLTMTIHILTVSGPKVFDLKPIVCCDNVLGFDLLINGSLSYYRIG